MESQLFHKMLYHQAILVEKNNEAARNLVERVASFW